MTHGRVNRRTLLKGATALGALAASGGLFAQQAGPSARTPAALPQRGAFVIRGATVLTMDPNLGDFAPGDVHVRDGAIVAVGRQVEAGGAQVLDGAGMICMPGFVDTHWHLWTSLFRPYVRADVGAFGYFPVTSRLGPHMTPEDSYRSVRLGIAEALSAGVTTVHNWAHNVRSPSTPTPSSPPCAMRASAGASPTAPYRACPTTSRWTWPASPAPRRPGCRATASSPWASARATSARSMSAAPARAASSPSTCSGRTGAERVRSDCRSPCTPPAPARSWRWSRQACSAPTCS